MGHFRRNDPFVPGLTQAKSRPVFRGAAAPQSVVVADRLHAQADTALLVHLQHLHLHHFAFAQLVADYPAEPVFAEKLADAKGALTDLQAEMPPDESSGKNNSEPRAVDTPADAESATSSEQAEAV